MEPLLRDELQVHDPTSVCPSLSDSSLHESVHDEATLSEASLDRFTQRLVARKRVPKLTPRDDYLYLMYE